MQDFMRLSRKGGCLLSLLLEAAYPNAQRRAAAKAAVNSYLRLHCSKWFDVRLPGKQLDCTMTSGNRFAFMVRCAGPALLCVDGLRDLVEVLTGGRAGAGQRRRLGLGGKQGTTAQPVQDAWHLMLRFSSSDASDFQPCMLVPCSLPGVGGDRAAGAAHRAEH